jgi:hypothetical protein
MKTYARAVALATVTLIASRPAAAQDLQQKLAAAKAAAAKNAQALRSYTWLEKTELSLKGEVKNTKVESCKYGPDGKVQKTLVTPPPEPKPKQRGLKGKIVEKKTGEMKEELESAAALVQRYVPPSPDKMQAVIGAGHASAGQSGPNAVAFVFSGYEKPGDALTLTFDTAITGIRGVAVSTWLDKPDEPVTLNVTMQSLPDGLSYPGSIALSIPSSKVEVRITKSNYQKLAM